MLPRAMDESASFLTALSLEYAIEYLNFCASVRWKFYLRVVLIYMFLVTDFFPYDFKFLFLYIFAAMYCQFISCAFFFFKFFVGDMRSSQCFSQLDVYFSLDFTHSGNLGRYEVFNFYVVKFIIFLWLKFWVRTIFTPRI